MSTLVLEETRAEVRRPADFAAFWAEVKRELALVPTDWERLLGAGGQTVAPGQNASFTFTVTAPSTPGNYPLRYQMLHQNVGWFGDISPQSVTVGAAPVVSVTTGAWQPNPALVSQVITSTVSAGVTGTPTAPSGDSVSQNWTWTTGRVFQSADGSAGSFGAGSNYSIGWTQGSAATQFSGSFINAGYYIVEVKASVTFHDDTAGTDIGTYSGLGYIGDNTFVPPAASAVLRGLTQGRSPHQLLPNAAGSAKGIGVTALTITQTGTTPDSNQNPNILVGQQCTATVVGIRAALLPYTTYNWIPSGVTFQSWSPTSPTNANAAYLVSGIPATNPTQWCWNDPNPATETIKCIVTVTPPAGQGSPYSQTITAPKQISVQFPQWKASGIGGYMQVNTYDPAYPITDYALYAGPTLAMDYNNQPGGINVTAYNVKSATQKHQFVDYLLYQPPGSNSQWITLAQFNWSVNGSATLPTTGNWADFAGQNGSDAVGTVTPNTTTQFTSVYGPNFFVSWTRINVFPNF